MTNKQPETLNNHIDRPMAWRISGQPLLPVYDLGRTQDNKTSAGFQRSRASETSADYQRPRANETAAGPQGYDIYPLHSLGTGAIHAGYKSLAAWMATQKIVLIDGYVGVFWKSIQEFLDCELQSLGVTTSWYDTASWQKEEADISRMVSPFIGGEGDLWGKKTTLDVADFFNSEGWASLTFPEDQGLHIVIGTGAALAHPDAPMIYCELAKNELQYRMRAGTITNLGGASPASSADHTSSSSPTSLPGPMSSSSPASPAEMYKRFYFVDWIVLNKYKRSLRHRINVLADVQWADTLTWIFQEELEQGLRHLTRSAFRVRPWFEPGVWGGQWMKEHISGINKEEVNYAWSFEMIVPENGVLLESDGILLEIPFEWLMYQERQAILGRHAHIFGDEFPIRFDFLDTFDGGNLSIQCHPSLPYIRDNFGETITQDETYYILDCKEGAAVYLGFQEGIDPADFRAALEDNKADNTPVPIEQYIQRHNASRHDLFLIPNRTAHSAGADNMVLEISATPYIFTFKMYDWVRLGLDGQPRSINIGHAFHNLDFTRQGAIVKEELLSKPAVLAEGEDWQLWHLPTHAEHFYDVHRLEFDTEITFPTEDYCQVMMLVEGSSVCVTTANGATAVYHYAETFVIPASAVSFHLRNLGEGRARVIKAFIKKEHYIFDSLMH